jgi:small subunit ribosomal protein S13
MARISGIDLPPKKSIEVSLTYIYGIGSAVAARILDRVGIERNFKTDQLTDQQVAKIRAEIEQIKVEGDLRKEVSMNVKRLMDLGAYRGLRHRANLPCRGQRTNTNARTRKGRPRIAIAGKKKAPTSK